MHWREWAAHLALRHEEIARVADETDTAAGAATGTSGGFGTPPPANVLRLLPGYDEEGA